MRTLLLYDLALFMICPPGQKIIQTRQWKNWPSRNSFVWCILEVTLIN